MASVQIECAYCGNLVFKPAGGVNRSRRIGAPVFCGRECSGLARRSGKTDEQKRAEKKEYDATRRMALADQIKAAKHEYHKRTYDPAKAATERKARMPRHVEYCRQPEYRAWKRDYDRQYRAKQYYGPFWESFILMMDIRSECLRQMTDYEIRIAKGTFGKSQQRKRAYERSLREEPQVGPMGDLELGQGWQNGGLASGLRCIPGPRNSSHDEHATARVATSQASGRGGRHHVRGNLNCTTRKAQGGPNARALANRSAS